MNRQWLAACLAALVFTACSDSNNGAEPEPVPPPGSGTGDPAPRPDPEPVDETPRPTPIGTAIGAPVSVVIGPAGGRLSSADGSLTVQVPAGAFSVDRTVSIQAISNHAHGGRGAAFRILPEGIETTVPMTVSFRYFDSDLRGTALDRLMMAYQDANGVWQAYSSPAIDTAQRTLTIETRHFSDWAMIVGAQILPHSASIRPGEELSLQVVYCSRQARQGPPDDEGIPSPTAVIGCEVDTNAYGADAWSVNGVEGGGGQFGSVVADPVRWKGRATYTAPMVKPEQNNVSVSARHRFLEEVEGETLLVSKITLMDATTDCSLRDVEQLHVHLSFTDFNFTATYPNYLHTGHHSGQLLANVRRVTPPGISPVIWMSYRGSLERGYVFINDSTTYTPPDGDGYAETYIGQGPPDESLNGGRFITLLTHPDSCTYDIIGSFFVDGTYSRNGASQNGSIGVGALYVHGQEMQPDQVAAGFIDGMEDIPLIEHNPYYDQSGYDPLDTIGSGARKFSGSTVARWQISVVE